VEGDSHDRHSLAQIESAARELALFHLAVLDFETRASKAWPRYDSPILIRGGVADVEKRLSPEHRDDLAYVRSQVVLLEERLSDGQYNALPKYVVHGDYHPANMLFRGDAVAGIFDLDWASRQPRVRDLADGVLFYAADRAEDIDGADIASLTRAATYNEERVQLFLSTYHQTLPIKEDEMAALPQFLRARWLHCRAAGMSKVSEERKEPYFFEDIRVPLEWIDEHEKALSVLPSG
jgi:Ser/Thr protein kinase RdoA (MazF antagonist)